MKKVTIKDVANLAGVSPALVSFVINNERSDSNGVRKKYSVNPATAKKIKEAADSLGYRPNMTAASLRMGTRNTIGVILPDISNSFFCEVARTIETIAYRYGYMVLFTSTDESNEKMEQSVLSLLNHDIDGAIVTPGTDKNEILQKFTRAGIPVVLLDRDIEGEEYGRVMLDNSQATYQAVRYLRGQGHSKIEMINYDNASSCNQDREIGYRQAMREEHLDDLIHIHYVPNRSAGKKRHISEVVDDMCSRDVTGLILPTNTISSITMDILSEKHLLDRFSCVCFDLPAVYDVFIPGLARINQNATEIARNACDMLVRMIRAEEGPRHVIMPPTITFEQVEKDYSSIFPADQGHFDLCVIGAGCAGICAAVAAARLGLSVALVEISKTLGGSNSSVGGAGLRGRINIGPFPSLGYLLNEFAPAEGGAPKAEDDERKMRLVVKEKNIRLFSNFRCEEVVKSNDRRIISLIAANGTSARKVKISATVFCDCSGNAALGSLAGAENVAPGRIFGLGVYPEAAVFPDDCVGVAADRPALRLSHLISRDIDNLLMAGESCSVAPSVSVLSRPLAVTGEVAGCAAALCTRHNCRPRAIPSLYWEEFSEILSAAPGRTNLPYTQVYDLN